MQRWEKSSADHLERDSIGWGPEGWSGSETVSGESIRYECMEPLVFRQSVYAPT